MDDALRSMREVHVATLETLDEVFSDTAAPEPEPEGVIEAPEPAPEPEPEPEPEATPAPEPEPESWTKKAALDERRKRQELERENAELKAKLEKPAAPRPSVLEDEDGAFSHLEQKFESARLSDRIAMSREIMTDMKPDYSEKESLFIEISKDRPDLITQMRAHPHPAKFAYEQATKHSEYQAMQNVDEYKAKLRAEVEAEVRKEIETSQAKHDAKATALKPSLASARSANLSAPITDALEDIVRGAA